MLDCNGISEQLKLDCVTPLRTMPRSQSPAHTLTLRQRQAMEARGQQKGAKQAAEQSSRGQKRQAELQAEQQALRQKATRQREQEAGMMADARKRLEAVQGRRAAATKLVDAREVEARQAAKAR